MRISDWSSDVCSSDLILAGTVFAGTVFAVGRAGPRIEEGVQPDVLRPIGSQPRRLGGVGRQVRFDGGAATAVELAVHVGLQVVLDDRIVVAMRGLLRPATFPCTFRKFALGNRKRRGVGK